MVRLGQGHLNPKSRGPRTDMSPPRIEPGPPRWKPSRKEPFVQLVNIYSEIYLWARDSIVDTYLLSSKFIWLLKILIFLGSLKSKKKGQVLEFQNVPGCGLRALVGHLQDLTEAGKHSEDILNYVNLRQKVGLEI
jgi:hypothetical protein